MLWLDSSYPPEKAGQPGGDRGDCPQDSGVPADVEAEHGSVRPILPLNITAYSGESKDRPRPPSPTATSASAPSGPRSTFNLPSPGTIWPHPEQVVRAGAGPGSCGISHSWPCYVFSCPFYSVVRKLGTVFVYADLDHTVCEHPPTPRANWALAIWCLMSCYR